MYRDTQRHRLVQVESGKGGLDEAVAILQEATAQARQAIEEAWEWGTASVSAAQLASIRKVIEELTDTLVCGPTPSQGK